MTVVAKKKRRMMSDADVKGFKVSAKKKKGRRTEIETPKENAETPLEQKKRSDIVRSNVPFGELLSVMQETVWRFHVEVAPNIEHDDSARLQSDESARVIGLGMLVGWPEQKPRKGLRMRQHEYEGKEIPLCRKHR